VSFRISSSSRDYFDDIEDKSTTGSFDTMWDKYYMSAMVGIKARDRVITDDEPTAESFTEDVITDYEDQKYEIYGALITAEIERQGIPKREKAEIRQLMLKILNSRDATRLSEHGKKLLNCYAEQGYRILQNKIPEPGDFDQFLKQYHNILELK
jgi:hypothetical protein